MADAVEAYLAVRTPPQVPALRDQPGLRRSEPLFLTGTGRRVHVSHVQALLRRLCATVAPGPDDPAPRSPALRELLSTERVALLAEHLAPLRDSVHPHSARHSYATHAITRGAEPRQVQHDLGHAALSTTEGYLHDAESLANSAAHELSPALHRGWLR